MSWIWVDDRMIKMPDKEQLRLSDFSYLEDLKGIKNVRHNKKVSRY